MQIKKIRRMKGLSLRELAEMASVSYVFLSNVENEKMNVSLKILRQLAKVLEVSVCDLIEEPTQHKRRGPLTYDMIYRVSRDNSLSRSKRQTKLEGMLNTVVCEIRDRPPKNKTQSDRYWYKLTEISREISRVREERT